MKYFKKSEWKNNPDKVSDLLKDSLDLVREYAGVPIHIHVAYDDSGHSNNSYHYKGKAVDFHFGGLTPLEQFACIKMIADLRGVGYYPWWNNPGWHVDLRPDNLFWLSSKKGKYIYGNKKFINTIIKG